MGMPLKKLQKGPQGGKIANGRFGFTYKKGKRMKGKGGLREQVVKERVPGGARICPAKGVVKKSMKRGRRRIERPRMERRGVGELATGTRLRPDWGMGVEGRVSAGKDGQFQHTKIGRKGSDYGSDGSSRQKDFHRREWRSDRR